MLGKRRTYAGDEGPIKRVKVDHEDPPSSPLHGSEISLSDLSIGRPMSPRGKEAYEPVMNPINRVVWSSDTKRMWFANERELCKILDITGPEDPAYIDGLPFANMLKEATFKVASKRSIQMVLLANYLLRRQRYIKIPDDSLEQPSQQQQQ
jgi:hypothetical protein